MIIEKTTKNIISSGNIESASCTIDASDMRYIASLLRNNYSDTKLATIREIVANALDVSDERMVEVQLPTQLEPNFIVRDFGCGLSEDDMMGLYTKYGKSTKRGSNNAIGGFGIGRFAPLSYTESFVVASVFEGRKTSYSIRIDEHDDTVVSKMFSEESSEENGIYVQVPVKNDDINQFNKIFKNFSAYLSDKLHLLNEEFDVETPTVSCETFDLYERVWSSSSQFNHSPYVLMGGILYPVNTSLLPAKSHIRNGVVYKAEIGEFKLHHSREALEYNEKTLVALEKASEKIANSFVSLVEAKVANSANLYDACRLYKETLKPASAQLVIKQNQLWNGYDITSLLSHKSIVGVQRIQRLRNGNLSLQKVRIYQFDTVNFNKDTYYVIDDHVDVKALKNRLSWIEKEVIYVVSPTSEGYSELIERAEAMGDKHVSLLSSHERQVAPRKASSTPAVSKGDIMELKFATYRNSDCWNTVDEELSDNETHYYVEWHSNKVRTANYDRSPQDYFKEVCQLRKINPKLSKVYGVRKKALAQIEKKSNWVALESVKTDWINNSEVVKNTKLYYQISFALRSVTKESVIKEAIEKTTSNEIILNLKKSIEARKEAGAKADLSLEDYIMDRASELDISEHEKNCKAFEDAYPLCNHLSIPYGSDETKQVVSALVDYLQR